MEKGKRKSSIKFLLLVAAYKFGELVSALLRYRAFYKTWEMELGDVPIIEVIKE